MIKIQGKLRPANLPNVEVPNSYTLVINQSTGESFFQQGNRLVYLDPAGVPETVMEGDAVALFEVTNGDEEINIKLKLDKENIGTVVLETAVKPRN